MLVSPVPAAAVGATFGGTARTPIHFDGLSLSPLRMLVVFGVRVACGVSTFQTLPVPSCALWPVANPKSLLFVPPVLWIDLHQMLKKFLFFLCGCLLAVLSCAIKFAIPHVTRTDERVMQVHSMLRKFLERDPQTRGRDLAVQVPVVVPITPRMWVSCFRWCRC